MNNWELQRPCTITIHGSTLKRRRCIVPPIWKLWPFADDSPSFSHIALHLFRNHVCFMGDHWPLAVSKAKRGVEVGTSELDEKWCSRVDVALQGHVELVALMISPFSFVLVQGMWKFMYLRLLAAMLHLIWVEWDTCKVGSNSVSTRSSPSLP